MNDFSLMYPAGRKPEFKSIGNNTYNDLSLDHIIDFVTENDQEKKIIKGYMTKLESDPEIIRYRGDIFEDILEFPVLREKMKELLEQLEFLKTVGNAYKDDPESSIWQLIDRLQELDVYVKCITGLNEVLTRSAIKSEGLMMLKDYVTSVYNESGFEYLSDDIKELVNETAQIRSISLGVNLDSRLRPVEVGIVSINREGFGRFGLLDKFLDFASKKGELNGEASFNGMARIHTVGPSPEDAPLMNNLRRVVTDMLGTTVRHLRTKLSRFADVSGYSLVKLIPELIFYIRWAEFITKVRELGLPVTRPEIFDTKRRFMRSEGMYDIKLAMQKLGGRELSIVENDFEFTKDHGIYIMTGPNRGGKTTFTQAVGVLFLMAQNGLFVPARSVRLSPCDCIYTHFPADENETVNLGRLGEESRRLSEIFSAATDKSLLLFNESLATTSFTEGLYIAKDVVRAMRYLGARAVFNTHMHELAMNLEEINALRGDMKVASLITGVHEGQRSYKVFIAPPEGMSYARDIAGKYGVTFEQLRSSIDSNAEEGRQLVVLEKKSA